MAVTFGATLKALREEKGFTQQSLADAAGIPIGTVRDYEQGLRDPLLSNAQRLAAALGVSLDTFPPPPKRKPRGKGKRRAAAVGKRGATSAPGQGGNAAAGTRATTEE